MFEYKNIKVNYVRYGNKKKDTLVYLHGWGQNIEMMKPIADPFSDDFDIVILDLPGFGKSEEPKEVFLLDDYVECIKELLDSLKIKNPTLIGHSFGGKLSILYASKYDCKKVVLLASPFKSAKSNDSVKTKILKGIKKLPGMNALANKAKKYIGSTDYKNASPIMREILVKHVSTDLTDKAKLIKCPTLIIWGTLDEAVDVNDAYELEKLIPDAGVVIYEGCTHYAYLERKVQTINVLKSFFK